ncbi:P2 phage tail completion protein R (GpR) [Pseudomonas sp. GM74]|uniref:phage tail protein n=1 Tax=Pseudomonas sp. GM74 TaxID=1144336 RepID=UPI000270C27B|nr:phage tail protein [Pseudomonas sp. GM74]EJM93499.1 P2 phage tail completion protein R (GpR) [Pseudomonas sp. GM74]PNB72495.1 phage tail protein [Pseudomonas sp. GW456-E7]
MEKLRALTKYLIEHRVVVAEQLESCAEQVNLTLVWKPEELGLHMGDMRYRAVIFLERFTEQPARLMALLGTWLVNNDPDRHLDELPAPTFDIEQMDPDASDVEITVEFIEPLHLTESPDGEFEAFGTTWALEPFDLWIAERGEVLYGA